MIGSASKVLASSLVVFVACVSALNYPDFPGIEIAESDCFQDDFFVFVHALVDFNGANTACQEYLSGTLARIETQEVFNFVDIFVDSESGDGETFWIGLKDQVQISGNGNSTKRFEYVDGFSNNSFYQEPFEFPWGEDQPNDSGNETCVV